MNEVKAKCILHHWKDFVYCSIFCNVWNDVYAILSLIISILKMFEANVNENEAQLSYV